MYKRYLFFFFKQKTAYEIGVRLVGSEMCIRDRYMENFARRYGELHGVSVATDTPEHFLTDLQAAGYVR